MATVAHGRTSSNNQRGTVGLSAGDYIRLKRLNGAKNYARSGPEPFPTADLEDNKDINPPPNPQSKHALPIHVYPVVGTSRIRRPASSWTDFRASQTADVMQIANFDPCQYPRVPLPIRLCNCVDNVIEPGPKLAGGKCCIGKPKGRYDGIIEVGTDITVCQNEKEFKLYTFTPPTTGTYIITANDIDSDPDLFISYPGGQINTAYVAAEDDPDGTVLYWDNGGSTSQISDTFEGGQTYEVMIFQYNGSCFELTVTD